MNGLEIALMALGIATLCGGVALAAVKIVELAQWKRKMDAGHSAAMRAIEELREAARDTLQAENADFKNAQDWCQRLNDQLEELKADHDALGEGVEELEKRLDELEKRVDGLDPVQPELD